MSDPVSATTPPPPDADGDSNVTPFQSLTALSQEHSLLLRRYNQLRTGKGGDEGRQFWRDVESFMKRGRATGVYLTGDSARWSAQGMLDYWSTALYRAQPDRVPVEAVLLSYDKTKAETLSDDLECPYVGLEAFRDGTHFYGRQRLLDGLLDKLRESRLVAVVGPSGSGKSSLVMGGLLPALGADKLPGSRGWYCFRPIVPGSDALDSLVKLFPAPAGETPEAWRKRQADALAADPAHLARLVGGVTGRPAVLLIDQFEEAFTLSGDKARRLAFLDALLSLTRADGPRHVVLLTMRSDHLHYIKELPHPAGGEEPHPFNVAFVRGQVPVTSMDSKELREAIVRPAEAVRVTVDEYVVDELIQEVALESAALPLLQFTLLKLWDLRDNNLITKSAFIRLGGAHGALEKTAESLYARLLPERQEVLRQILLRMAMPTKGFEFTRRRVTLKSLFADNYAFDSVKDVLGKLIGYRLVRLTGNKAHDSQSILEGLTPDDIPEDVRAEVVHEALVRNWDRLVKWLNDTRASMRIHAGFEEKAREWVRLGKSGGGLLDEVQLAEAERWLGSPDAASLVASDSLKELAAASRRALEEARAEKERQYQALLDEQRQRADAEARRADQQTRAKRFLIGGLVVIAVAASMAILQRNEANRQSRLAHSNQLAAQALFFLDKQPDLSLLLSSQAAAIDTDNVAARNSLVNVLEYHPELKVYLPHREYRVNAFAFPSDSRLVGVGEGGQLVAWDLTINRIVEDATRQLPADLLGPDRVTKIEISPQGDKLAVGGARTFAVFRLGDGPPEPLLPPTARTTVIKLCFSPDGKKLAVSGGGGLSWYDLETKEAHDLRSDGIAFTTLTFSGDSQRLAAGRPGLVSVWTLAAPDKALQVQNSFEGLVEVAFLSSGDKLVIAAGEGNVRIWTIGGGPTALGDPLSDSNKFINDLVVSPRRDAFAWSDVAGNIYFYDESASVAGEKNAPEVFTYVSQVQALAVSPDGTTLASASHDNKVNLWSLADARRRPFRERLNRGGEKLLGVTVVSADKTLAVSSGATGDAVVNLNSKEDRAALPRVAGRGGGSPGRPSGAAFRPDGAALASYGDGDQDVFFWALAGGGWDGGARAGHVASVSSVAFSRDGKFLASGDDEGKIVLRDAGSGEARATLAAHSASVSALAFSPDGKLLVSCGLDNKVALWQTDGGASYGTFNHQSPVRSVAFSHDGKTLASAGDDKVVRFWDVAARAEQDALEHQTMTISALAFSPDDSVLAAGDWAGMITIWNLKPRARLYVLTSGREKQEEKYEPPTYRISGGGDANARRPQPWEVRGLAFGPGGRQLISLSASGAATRWNTQMETWSGLACAIANRSLSDEEKGVYLPAALRTASVCEGLGANAATRP